MPDVQSQGARSRSPSVLAPRCCTGRSDGGVPSLGRGTKAVCIICGLDWLSSDEKLIKCWRLHLAGEHKPNRDFREGGGRERLRGEEIVRE